MNYIETNTLNIEELTSLYHSVGWSSYTNDPKVMASIIPNSLWTLAAYDKEELVGLIRIIGDGVSIIYVQDLLVNPSHQRQGIGKELLNITMKKFAHIRQIVLMTEDEEKTKAFYESSGLKQVNEYGAISFAQFK